MEEAVRAKEERWFVMKYTKTSIGEIAFIPCDCTRKKSLKLVPKDCRLIKRWELLKLFDKESKKLANFIKHKYITTEPRVCYLIINHYFIAYDRNIVSANGRVHGVAIIKKRKEINSKQKIIKCYTKISNNFDKTARNIKKNI